jgi:V-type ATP synthase, subunit E
MTDYSQLKDSILEQAHEKGRKLVAEATAKVQAESQLQEARLVEEKLHQRAVQLQTIERHLQRESQQIENQKRQSTLVTKQRVLKELFADAYQKMAAWSREEELAFLHRILPRYADQAMVLTLGAVTAEKLTDQDCQDLIEAYPQLQLAKETLAQEAGFILSFGKVDASYLYRDLVDAVREEQSFHMAASIFKEEKN